MKSISRLVVCLFVAAHTCTFAQNHSTSLVKQLLRATVIIQPFDGSGGKMRQGNGFFINDSGDVITNRHILRGAVRGEIVLHTGEVCDVVGVLAEQPENDVIRIAVKVAPGKVRALSVTKSLPTIGERLIVVSPLQGPKDIDEGRVSDAKVIAPSQNRIGSTLHLSQETSGSPVVNSRGEVIGVATNLIVAGSELKFVASCLQLVSTRRGIVQPLAEWKSGEGDEWLSSSRGLYATGFMFFWAEQYEKALSYYDKASKLDPGNPNALFQLGYCQKQLGHLNEALNAFKEVLRLKPDDVQALINLGLVYGGLRRTDEAITSFQDAVAIQPDDPSAYYNVGVMYSRVGKSQQALNAFRKATELKPDYADAYYNMGVVYGMLHQYAQEVKAYQVALRLDPNSALTQTNLGIALSKIHRDTQAIEAFKIAIRLNPKDAEGYFNLGTMYKSMKRDSEAVESLRKAVRLKPDHFKAYMVLGTIYGEQDLRDDAVAALKQATKIQPNVPEPHYMLGALYKVMKNQDAAMAEYTALKEIDKEMAARLWEIVSHAD